MGVQYRNGKYFGGGSGGDGLIPIAKMIKFANKVSGRSSTNVQDVIDEIDADVSQLKNTTTKYPIYSSTERFEIQSNTNYTVPDDGYIIGNVHASNSWSIVYINNCDVYRTYCATNIYMPFYIPVKKGDIFKLECSDVSVLYFYKQE